MDILSVDFGTSSLKMAVLDENTNILETATVEYQYRVFNEDWVELDPDEVFGAMAEGAKKLSGYLNKVGIVCYDTFSPSMVFMDQDGEALHPIIAHLDRRSKKQTTLILDVMGKDAFQSITGVQPFTGGVSITTILWMMENMPEVFNKTYKMGHLVTYIYHRLTGMWATDPVNASMMGLYETTKWGGWSDEILNTFKIPRGKLPDIHNAGTVLGPLTKNAADLLGLKAGIPVTLGANDAAMAHVGAGNTEEGDILDISGSSEILTILSDKPVVNDFYYLRNAVTPGQWQIFAITTGGFAIDWFRKEFYRDMDAKEFYNTEVPDVIRNYVGKTSAVFLPYLAGDRHSLTPKKGGFEGLTLDTTRKDMLASIFIGMHEPVLKTVELSGAFMRHNKNIKLTGGMISEQFIDLKKKLFKGFDFIVKENCPILGNGILALRALGKKGDTYE
jgi:sugar (pentulose or hexulose) kinase